MKVHQKDRGKAGGKQCGVRGDWARRVEVSYPPRPTPTPSFRHTALHFRRHCCRCVSLHCQWSLFFFLSFLLSSLLLLFSLFIPFSPFFFCGRAFVLLVLRSNGRVTPPATTLLPLHLFYTRCPPPFHFYRTISVRFSSTVCACVYSSRLVVAFRAPGRSADSSLTVWLPSNAPLPVAVDERGWIQR